MKKWTPELEERIGGLGGPKWESLSMEMQLELDPFRVWYEAKGRYDDAYRACFEKQGQVPEVSEPAEAPKRIERPGAGTSDGESATE